MFGYMSAVSPVAACAAASSSAAACSALHSAYLWIMNNVITILYLMNIEI